MTFSNTQEFLEISINLIQELINVKSEIIEYLNDIKEVQSIKFKIRSYQKWIQILNKLKNDKNIQKTNISSEIIKDQKFTSGLEKKLIQILNTNKIIDIEEDKNRLNDLKKQHINKNSKEGISIKNNNTSNQDESDIILSNSNITSIKILPKDEHNIQKLVTKINTIEIEGIPKQLINQSRPKDDYLGAIYDLKLVTGIGPKNAEKFANEGITVEVLLHDWNKFVEKNKRNSIIMLNKIGKPTNISFDDYSWNKLSDEKKHSYQATFLNKKLEIETNYLHKLTHHQLVGIKYFWDILQRIPRKEIIDTEKFLKKVANAINNEIIITVCGSYRRGKNNSGDIDTLITHPKIKTDKDLENSDINILKVFVKQLEAIGYLTDHLAESGKTKYMGLGLYSNKYKIARRIDIRFVPYNSYGAAILYFTGSKDFNTNMRKHAINKGFKLNEYGLYKKLDSKNLKQIECSNEEDIFKALDYPYVKPTDRNI